jgi:hypothetical protein
MTSVSPVIFGPDTPIGWPLDTGWTCGEVVGRLGSRVVATCVHDGSRPRGQTVSGPVSDVRDHRERPHLPMTARLRPYWLFDG